MTLTVVPVPADADTAKPSRSRTCKDGEARESTNDHAFTSRCSDERTMDSRDGGQNLFVGQKPSTARAWQVVCGSCFIFCPAITF